MLVVLLGPRYGTGVALGISLMILLANIAGELLAVVREHVVVATRSLSRWPGGAASLARSGATGSA